MMDVKSEACKKLNAVLPPEARLAVRISRSKWRWVFILVSILSGLFTVLPYILICTAPLYIFALPQIYNSAQHDFYAGTDVYGLEYSIGENALLYSPVGTHKITITSGFGMRRHPVYGDMRQHNGIDISCPEGTPVYAVLDGTVEKASYVEEYGNLVVLRHQEELSTYYAHLSKILVKGGDEVQRGSLIAFTGNTGVSTGPHLHFEVRKNNIPIDPKDYLDLKINVPDVLPDELKYVEIDKRKLQEWLNEKNSMLADEPYFSAILDTAKEYDINPLFMFAITGQEQSFVPRSNRNAEKIANNPFNVYHSWQKYNTDIYDTARIAARTIINLSKGRPAAVHPVYWINTRGGSGGYAEDTNWWIGVTRIFEVLKKFCQEE